MQINQLFEFAADVALPVGGDLFTNETSPYCCPAFRIFKDI
jgi:hypothetical protein